MRVRYPRTGGSIARRAAVSATSARPAACASTGEALRAKTVVPPQCTSKLKPPAEPACSRSKWISTRSPAVRKPAGMAQFPMLASVMRIGGAAQPAAQHLGIRIELQRLAGASVQAVARKQGVAGLRRGRGNELDLVSGEGEVEPLFLQNAVAINGQAGRGGRHAGKGECGIGAIHKAGRGIVIDKIRLGSPTRSRRPVDTDAIRGGAGNGLDRAAGIYVCHSSRGIAGALQGARAQVAGQPGMSDSCTVPPPALSEDAAPAAATLMSRTRSGCVLDGTAQVS